MQSALYGLTALSTIFVFFYGMHLMRRGWERLFKAPVCQWLRRSTGPIGLGFLIGFFTACVLQSSLLVIVLLGSLRAAHAISLRQCAPVLLGTQAGTAMSVQLLRLAVNSRMTALVSAGLVLGVGIFLICTGKTARCKSGAMGCVGFSFLLLGLHAMTQAAQVLLPQIFHPFFSTLYTPLSSLLIGFSCALAAQSTSAAIGVLQALAASGTITLGPAGFYMAGAALGSAVAAFLLCQFQKSPQIHRMGWLHLAFSAFSTIAALVVLALLRTTPWPNTMATANSLANIQLVFHLACSLFLVPLCFCIKPPTLHADKPPQPLYHRRVPHRQ